MQLQADVVGVKDGEKSARRDSRPLRVLLISHTCQSRTEGQPKAELLARYSDIDLRVLVPHRWLEYDKWRSAEVPEKASFTYEVGRILWPWTGPVRSYLPMWYLHGYPGLARLLKEFRPDIIDLWEESWGLVSAHTCWLRNRLLPGTRIITETEQNINRPLPFPFERFRRYTIKNADFAVGRSAEAAEVLRANGYTGPAAVVPNAVDTELFRPMDRGACRRALGLSGFVVGYMGQLHEKKGLMDMVDALAGCPEDVQMLFVGSGPFQESLERRVQELGKTKQVRFLPRQSQDQLPQVMNALDALALVSRTTPSWKEQFGRVIIEAHACQTPVIGSDSGAIPDVVGRGGLVVPEQDPAALADAIRRLHARPEWGREMGLIGRRQVEENYTWARVAERMRDCYRQTMEEARRYGG